MEKGKKDKTRDSTNGKGEEELKRKP